MDNALAELDRLIAEGKRKYEYRKPCTICGGPLNGGRKYCPACRTQHDHEYQKDYKREYQKTYRLRPGVKERRHVLENYQLTKDRFIQKYGVEAWREKMKVYMRNYRAKHPGLPAKVKAIYLERYGEEAWKEKNRISSQKYREKQKHE